MTTILATIFVFGIIVFVHELGHFITAKLCGMVVEEFAIGFGPAIYSKRKGETLYSIRSIPLGGYNKISGMSPEEELTDRSFINKPAWQRFIVISAGAIMNFLLAILIFFSVFSIVGMKTPSQEAVVGDVLANSPAATAKLLPGDKIISIHNQPISKWTDITTALSFYSNTVTNVVVERNGSSVDLTVIPSKEEDGRAVIGIYPVMQVKHYSVGESFTMAISYTYNIIHAMVQGLYDMVTGATKAALSGPIGVAQMAGQVASTGFVSLLQFTAILSINLGIINLLPIPALDGGHLILILIEGITRRKLPPKALYYIQMTGVSILIMIFLYATISDVSRFTL